MKDSDPYGSDRRHSFRIDDDIYLDYRPLTESDGYPGEDSGDTLSRFCHGLTQLRELNARASHIGASLRKQQPELADYLTLIDLRIDALSQLVATVAMGDAIQPGSRVNLGSGGMAFSSREPLQQGQLLALTLVLFPSRLCLHVQARVAYCHTSLTEGRNWTGVEFEGFAESEQKALIRHMLEKESARA